MQLLLALLVFICGSAVAQEYSRPSYKIGDTWEYSYDEVGRSSSRYANIVVEVTQSSHTVHWKNFDNGNEGDIRYDRNNNQLVSSAHGDLQPYPVFIWPISTPGIVWKDVKVERVSGDKVIEQTFTSRFSGTESITVPAGTFTALRFEVVSSYITKRVGRSDYSNETSETWWFSPEVRNFVRRDYRDYGASTIVRKLIRYDLK